jgi:ABC-type transport system substrate-binding protein
LNRPQPAFIALLAAGVSPVYPCHVTPAQMRLHPVGTGRFKFVEFKPNESIKLVRNPDYWKKGRPYLDGIEYTIIPNRSTAILAFVTGNGGTRVAGASQRGCLRLSECTEINRSFVGVLVGDDGRLATKLLKLS